MKLTAILGFIRKLFCWFRWTENLARFSRSQWACSQTLLHTWQPTQYTFLFRPELCSSHKREMQMMSDARRPKRAKLFLSAPLLCFYFYCPVRFVVLGLFGSVAALAQRLFNFRFALETFGGPRATCAYRIYGKCRVKSVRDWIWSVRLSVCISFFLCTFWHTFVHAHGHTYVRMYPYLFVQINHTVSPSSVGICAIRQLFAALVVVIVITSKYFVWAKIRRQDKENKNKATK